MALLVIGALLAAAAITVWHFPRNRRWHWKLVGRIAAGILMCCSALTLLLCLFGTVMCGRYEFPPISSRDGKLTAEVSEEDCGATDSFHSSVHVWRDRQGFFMHLFGRRGHSTTVFTVGHDPRLIDLSWKDDRTLLIRYPIDSPYPIEFRCQSQWDGVQIECVGYAPDYGKPVSKMPPVHRGLW
jgi:hypothetical protein